MMINNMMDDKLPYTVAFSFALFGFLCISFCNMVLYVQASGVR